MINDVDDQLDSQLTDQLTTELSDQLSEPLDLGAHSRAYATWSDNEERQLLEMLILGTSFAEMAKVLGRSDSAVRSRALRLAVEAKYGRTVPDHPPNDRDGQPWTRQDFELLESLIATGRSWSEIGQRLARAPSSCRRRAEVAALRYFMEL